MITELGHFALILAFLVAIVQTVVPLVGAAKRWPGWMGFAEPAAIIQFSLVAFSFGALVWAFVTSDFSLRMVVENSHSAKPMIYKISGTWGNHEGSMLLWVLIVALFGAMAAFFGGGLPPTLKARVLAVQASIAVAFFAFIICSHRTRFDRLDRSSVRWARSEPFAAGPRFGLPSTVPVSGLCRPEHGIQLCRRRPDRGPGGRGLGPVGATVDAGRLGVSDNWYRAGFLVGLLRTGLGRLLVLGPG